MFYTCYIFLLFCGIKAHPHTDQRSYRGSPTATLDFDFSLKYQSQTQILITFQSEDIKPVFVYFSFAICCVKEK